MATTTGITAAEPPEGTPPVATPTVTHYQQLADDFMRKLDEIAGNVPKLEAEHVSTATFVRSHLNVSNQFLSTVTSGVEQTPELQDINKLDVLAARDTLQFIEAFRPVLDKVMAFGKNLQFTLNSRKASLVLDSLQIYDIAKGLARDPNSAALASLVRNMKRDLGRAGRPKIPLAVRKAIASAQATEAMDRATARLDALSEGKSS